MRIQPVIISEEGGNPAPEEFVVQLEDSDPILTQHRRANALTSSNFYFFFRKVIAELYPNHADSTAPYLEALCKAAQDVIEGREPRLLVTLPPRYLKSTCFSVALPAFYLGLHPDRDVMVATYSSEFAGLHAGQFRRVINSEWYQELFPGIAIARGQDRVTEMRLTRGGGRKGVSIEGSATGYGADLVIIDDLVKTGDVTSETMRARARQFYEETLVSRINQKEDPRIIAIQQRLHEDDFAAYLIDKGTFHHVNLPAIATMRQALPLYFDREYARERDDVLWPERESRQALETMRTEIGEYAFACQYQQSPIPRSSALVRFDDIPRIGELPDRQNCAPVIISVDPAFTTEPTSDFTVATIWGRYQEKWYLLDRDRARLDMPDLINRLRMLRARWSPDRVIIEADGSGRALAQQLRTDENGTSCYLVYHTRSLSKEERLINQSARLVSGEFVLPENPPWIEEMRSEFLAFPNGRHDDFVDSVSQALAWLHGNMGRSLMQIDPKTGRRRRPSRVRRR